MTTLRRARLPKAVLTAVCALWAVALTGCPNDAGISCPEGLQLCSGQCIVVGTDANNCGTCGMKCGAGLACIAGRCGCPAGLTACGDACVDTRSNPANCGACGKACGGGVACFESSCGCPSNLSACNGSCVDPMNDPQNCGSCGNSCGAGKFCMMGGCTDIMSCPAPFEVCASANGMSCTDTQDDSKNCGGCGIDCGFSAICCGGSCVVPNTAAHCGSCQACPDPNASCVTDGMGSAFQCFTESA